MKLEELDGKTVMLLLLSTADSGEDDWATITGRIELREHKLCFRGGPDVSFPLPEDVVDRITVATELKTCEGADFYLPLRVGPPPNDMATDDLVRTGLKWPEDEQEERATPPTVP